MKSPIQILTEYWGFTQFRPLQEDIINAVLNDRDTVALLPTGGGKSICFQIPALVKEGICIVVSPLVALMTDQVNGLRNKGIKALQLSGGLRFDEVNAILDNAMYGNYKFLYISPERLQQELVQNCIRQMTVNLIAVDEAHCISQWGNDFRPAYKNITFLREMHPLVPIIALTATATPDVLTDTIAELQLEMPAIFTKSFVRHNISYQVKETGDKLNNIKEILKNNEGSTIIYTRSRQTTVETCNHLNSMGIGSTFYHGGLSSSEKRNKLDAWQRGQEKVIVATSAFGMGIDKADVRKVIHTQLPENLESYFQEAGRAGRDGNYAESIILYSEYDKLRVKSQFLDTLATPKNLKQLYKNINNYFQIPYGEGRFSEHSFNFTDFCKQYSLNTLQTYNGLQTLDRLGVLKLSQEFGQKSKVHFIVPSNQLLSYLEKDMKSSIIIKTILRLYSGIFEGPVYINLELIASKTNQNVEEIIKVLRKLERDAMIEMDLRVTDASITFIQPREDDRTINMLSKEVELINSKKKTQVEAVLNYLKNDRVCKSLQLVHYFGEENTVPCGICSVCKKNKDSNVDLATISNEIVNLLENAEMTSKEIISELTYNENKIIQTLHHLLDAKKVKLNIRNQYYKT